MITQSTTPNRIVPSVNVTRAQLIIDEIRDLAALNRTDDIQYLKENLPVLLADLEGI